MLEEIAELVNILCDSGCIAMCGESIEEHEGWLDDLKSDIEKRILTKEIIGCPPLERSLMYKVLMLLEQISN